MRPFLLLFDDCSPRSRIAGLRFGDHRLQTQNLFVEKVTPSKYVRYKRANPQHVQQVRGSVQIRYL